jgi:hypothetical protein
MIAAFGEFQLLCALREGPYGVSGVNEQLEQMLNRKRAIALPRHSRWYEGRPVMISATTARWGCLTAISALRWSEARAARLVPDAGWQHQVGAAKSFAGARYRLGDDGA